MVFDAIARISFSSYRASQWLGLVLLSLVMASASTQLAHSTNIPLSSSHVLREFPRASPTVQETNTLLSSDGFTDVVQWDNYSLVVKGQRVFLQYVCQA